MNPEEVRKNLDSLRSVANQSAQSDLAIHTSKKLKESLLLKLFLGGASVILALILVTTGSVLYGILSGLIGIGMLANFVMSYITIQQSNAFDFNSNVDEVSDSIVETAEEVTEEYSEQVESELVDEDEENTPASSV